MSFTIAQGACNIDPMNSDCGCRIDSLGEGASKMDQLKLALTWNRVDVAEEKIFTPDTDWPVSEQKKMSGIAFMLHLPKHGPALRARCG